ncbi:MAG: hypothetical protein K2X93_02220 [Candidatus Obscuribacterales bacterium]|nr:hypothetical protein [Candidatus Obscuribacterales bacterium]
MKRHQRFLVLMMAVLLATPTSAIAQDLGMSALFTSAQSDSEPTTVPCEKGWASDANSPQADAKSESIKGDSVLSQQDASGESTATDSPIAESQRTSSKKHDRKQQRDNKKVAAKPDADSEAQADDPGDSKKKKAKPEKKAKSKGSKSDATDKKAEDSPDSKAPDSGDKDKKAKKEPKVKKASKKSKDKDKNAGASGSEEKDKKAEDSSDSKATDSNDKDKKEPKVKKASKKSNVPWPTRLTSFACCSVLGMPIAMAKSGYKQTLAGNKDLIGESKNPVKLLISTGLSIPFALAGGFLEGSGYSVINSWKGSAEEPFGKEAFSLEEPKPAAPDTPPQQ